MTAIQASEDEVDFAAAYVGPAVEAGRMNAKQFAPALFAMANLVERASTAAYGRPELLTVQVKANFRRGSFEFTLAAVAVVGNHLLQSITISDIDTLLKWIGLRGDGGGSLLEFLRLHGDKKIESAQRLQTGEVAVTVRGDNNTIVIAPQVYSMVRDDAVREQAAEIVAPLETEGINALRIGGTGNDPVRLIAKADVPRFQAPQPEQDELANSVAQTAVELLSPSFVDGNKWRVAQGGEPFWVRVLDQEFLDRVNSGAEGFFKGDYLIVEMRTRTYATTSGLTAEREIVKVSGHRQRPFQPRLL